MTAAALCLLAVACGKGGCEAPPFVPEGVDLNAGEAYANCYMVEKDGKYFFEAKRVDGSPVEGMVVKDGKITLPYTAKTVSVGLGYTSALCPMPLESDTQQGSTLGKRRAYGKCVLRLYRSVGGKYAATLLGDLWRPEAWKEREAYDIPFVPDTYGEACQPFSGDVEITLPSGQDADTSIWLMQDRPMPFRVAAIAMDVTTWYGSPYSSIRDVLFEEIEVDLNETLYSQQIQESDEDCYRWKTDWRPKLIVVNCDRLGPDLGNQVTGKVENFDSYHSVYDGIVFRNIHFAGEGGPLETILSRNLPQLEIRNLSLEQVETSRIQVEGIINNLSIKEL